MTLSAEDLLAGSRLTFEIEVPEAVLNPDSDAVTSRDTPRTVRIRPLNVQDLQLVSRAAKENDRLVAALMVQRALVEPEMSVSTVMSLHVGLMQFLLRQVNKISGIEASHDVLSDAIEAPLAKAAYVLAKEFGWTPNQFNELTLGQILLHLQKLKEDKAR
jgi:hypothetical protein